MNDLNLFPWFAVRYLGDNVLTCLNHHPTLDSCMLRIPHSINTKHGPEGHQVKITQEWDGISVSIKALELPFAEFLAKPVTTVSSTRRGGGTTIGSCKRMIDMILQKPIPDGRKIIIWKMLAPFFMNVVKLSEEDAFNKIMSCVEKCTDLRGTDITKDFVKSQLRNAQTFIDYNGERLKPISPSKLKTEYENIYDLIVN